MPKKFIVYYAGVPSTARKIDAIDRRKAAVELMKSLKAANSIVVSEGWMRETIFSSDEIRRECGETDFEELPLLRPEKGDRTPRPLWKEYLHRLLTGGSRRI